MARTTSNALTSGGWREWITWVPPAGVAGPGNPAAAGFARGSHHRVSGLRRSELATLAGISVEYVVRLEPGRVARPSAQVCSALARALLLSDNDHTHPLRMAGHAADPGRVPRLITWRLYRNMDQLDGNPLAALRRDLAVAALEPVVGCR